MLTEISRLHEVTYLSLLPDDVALLAKEKIDPYAADKIWISTSIVPKHSVRFWIDLVWNTVFSSKPYALEKYRISGLKTKLEELSLEGGYHLVICDFLAPALNFVGLDFSVPTLLFQHNIESQIWKRLASSQSSLLKRWYFHLQFCRMERWEQRLCQMFDGVITVSAEDTEIARSKYGLDNVLGHVPTGVDLTNFQPSSTRSCERPFTIGFLGSMDWMPNIDACHYFANEILPKIWQTHPQCHFMVIGRNPPLSVRNLAANDQRINVTGTVEDVQPYVHQCDVIAVPLLAGGGTRIKIYEAMAMGVPVVSTTIGAEGLSVKHGEDILLADDPKDFAAVLINLVTDQEMLQTLALNSRRQVEKHHSWTAATRRFLSLCDDAANAK
ncbi:MAG: glycosyltransferase family 4 protein [Prosthecobacter sp.]